MNDIPYTVEFTLTLAAKTAHLDREAALLTTFLIALRMGLDAPEDGRHLAQQIENDLGAHAGMAGEQIEGMMLDNFRKGGLR